MSEPTTMRDAIEAALDTAAPDTAPEPIAQPAPSGSDPGEERGGALEPQAAPSEGQDLDALAEGKEAESQTLHQRERDEQGKFKAKSEGVQPGPKAGPRQQADRAPQAWRPETREHWSQLPEPVRQEIQRREVEVQRTLQESAEARKAYDAIMRTIQPYEAFIRAENSNPIQAIDNLMRTGAQLRVGTPSEKAALVAGIVKQYNIDIEMLDSALAGQAPRVDPQQAAIDQMLNQRLAPVQQILTQFQQAQAAQQQMVTQKAQSEVASFLQRTEFGEDVRDEMADLLELAQRRGENLSLPDAYKKACMSNDRVRAVLQSRAKARGAQTQTAVAQKARQAAVSVTGAAPAGALRQDPTDVRSAIEAAIAMNSR
jgi:hypothetical protein